MPNQNRSDSPNPHSSHEYLSLSQASDLSPYSQEYLSLRARQGKLKAIKQGSVWFTTRAWLSEYQQRVEKAKQIQTEIVRVFSWAPVLFVMFLALVGAGWTNRGSIVDGVRVLTGRQRTEQVSRLPAIGGNEPTRFADRPISAPSTGEVQGTSDSAGTVLGAGSTSIVSSMVTFFQDVVLGGMGLVRSADAYRDSILANIDMLGRTDTIILDKIEKLSGDPVPLALPESSPSSEGEDRSVAGVNDTHIAGDLTVDGSLKTGEPSFIIDLGLSGNVIDFAGGGTAAGNQPQINLNQGGSRILDDGNLHVRTDDDLHLDAPGNVRVQNGLCLSGECRTTWPVGGGSGGVTGSGSANQLAKFTSPTALGNSIIFDDGSSVGIGTTSPGAQLDVTGIIQAGSGNINITTAAGNVDADALGLISGDGTGGTSSGSGLEVDTDRLGLLQGCANDQILKWVDATSVWSCAADAGAAGSSLQAAYNAGNTIDTSTARDIAFTLTNDVTDSNFTVTIASGSTSTVTFTRPDAGVAEAAPAQFLLIDNLDTNVGVANGIVVQTAGGGMTDGIDVSDAELVNAVNIGANDILSNGVAISSAELNLLDGHDVALVDTNDAVATAIIGTGALNSGSITSGFGAIDVGADAITTTGTITGGTINATTALQTAGTTRIDASGNLTNIGNLTATAALTIASTGAGNDITLNSADTIELVDNTNITGNLDVSGTLVSGTANAFQVDTSGNVTSGTINGQTISSTANFTGTVAVTTLGAAGTTSVCRNGSNQLASCSGAGGSDPSVTLQNAYVNGNSITTTEADGNIAFTLADTATDHDFLVDIQGTGNTFEIQDGGTAFITFADGGVSTFSDDVDLTLAETENLSITNTVTGTNAVDLISTILTNNTTSGTQRIALLQNAAGTGTTDAILALDNADTDTAVTDGLVVSSAAGAITDAIDLTDTDIVNAINIGDNVFLGTTPTINFTNLDIAGDGSFTWAVNSATDGIFNLASTGDFIVQDAGTARLTVGDDGSYTFALPAGTVDYTVTGLDADSQVIFSGLNSCDTIDTTAGGALICGTDAGAAAVTLQAAYDNGNLINTSDARDIDIELADDTTDSNLDIDIFADNTVSISRLDNAVVESPAQLLLLENLDTNLTMTDGIQFNVATGGVITDAIDVSDVDLVNAINIGANDIAGTNFSVAGGTGNITSGTINSQTITSAASFTGTVALATLGAAGSTAVCRNGSNQLATCSSNPSSVTLQQAYDAGNTISTGSARDIAFTLSDQATDSNFTVSIASGSTSTVSFTRPDAGVAEAAPTQFLLIDNLDTNVAVANGIVVQAAAGGMTDGLDVSDAELTNAVNVGDNTILGTSAVIDFTNFDVSSAGTVTIAAGQSYTGAGAVTISSTGGGNDVIINGADILDVQDAATFASTATFNGVATFNTDVDLTLAETENLTLTNTVTGTNAVDLVSATLTNNTTSGTQRVVFLSNASGSTGATERLLVLDNADDGTVATALEILGSSTGAVTTALDVSDAEIATALAIGANDISTSAGNGLTVTCSGGNFLQNQQTQAGITVAGTCAAAGGSSSWSALTAPTANLSLAHADFTTNFTFDTAADAARNYFRLGVTNDLVTDTTTQNLLVLENADDAIGTGAQESLLYLNNADANEVVTDAVLIQSAAGAITDAIDVSDADLVNAINIGANDIAGTNFSVAGATGNVTAGTINGQTITSAASFTGTVALATLGAAGSTAVCRNGSNQLATCSSNPSSVTLQQAYDAGNTISTGSARDIAFTLTDQATDSNFTVSIASGSTSTVSFTRPDAGVAEAAPTQFLLIDNLDTNVAVANGIVVQAAAGGITDGLDVSDAELTNALNVGDNTILGTTAVIDFTNFDLAGDGSFTHNVNSASNGIFNLSSTGDLVVQDAGSAFLTLSDTGGFDLTLDATDNPAYLLTNNGSGNVTTNLAGTGDFIIQDAGVNVFTVADDSSFTYALPAGTVDFSVTGLDADSQVIFSGLNSCDTIDTTAGGALVCGTDAGAAAATLQTAYEAGNTITTTEADGNIAFSLADTATDHDFIVDILGTANTFEVRDGGASFVTFADGGVTTISDDTDFSLAETENVALTNTVTGTNAVDMFSAVLTNNTTSGTQRIALLQNAAGTGTTERLLVLDNADDGALTTALEILGSSTGAVTTAIDASDPQIGTALSFGGNDIQSTNIGITGSDGSFSWDIAGTLSGRFNLTSTGDFVIQDAGTALLTVADDSSFTYALPAGTVDFSVTGLDADSQVIFSGLNSCDTIDTTAGGALTCGTDAGGGSVAWSSLTAPTANLSLAHADFTTNFTFDTAADAARNYFRLGVTNDLATDTTTQQLLVLENADDAIGTGTLETLLQLNNADANEAVTDAVLVQAAAGGITDAIDLTDTDIVNALNVGDNTILGTTPTVDFTNIDIAGDGSFTWAVNSATSGIFNLSSTGDFIVQAAGSDVFRVLDDGTARFFDDVDITPTNTENFIILSTVSSDATVDLQRISVDATAAGATGTLNLLALVNQNTTGAGTPDNFLVIDQQDVDETVATGILVQSAAGGAVTTALDVSDAEIGTAISVGANDILGTTPTINFTNIDIAGDGSFTWAINSATSGIFNLASTGDFIIQDAGVNVFTVADDSSFTYALPAGTVDFSVTGLDADSQVIFSGLNSCDTIDTTAGGALTCGTDAGGGSVAWSSLTAPTANLSLAHADFTTSFTFDTATDAARDYVKFSVTNDLGTDTTTQNLFVLENTNEAGSTGTQDSLLYINNADANEVVTDAVLIQSAAGAITDAIDLTDTDIVNAINIGDNVFLGTTPTINFTNLDIAGDGSFTWGVASGTSGIFNLSSTGDFIVQDAGSTAFMVDDGGVTQIAMAFQLTGDLSPSQITANQNDYNPSNLATSSVLRLDASKMWSITGLAGGADGRVLWLVNVGSFPIRLSHEDTGSTAANRFSFGGDVHVWPSDAVAVIYDSTSSRWRQFSVTNVNATFDPTSRLVLQEEFYAAGVSSNVLLGGVGFAFSSGGGAGSSAQPGVYGVDATNKASGVIQLDTGTTTTGGGGLLITGSAQAFTPTLGQAIIGWRIAPEALADATDEFDLRCGLADGSGINEGTDGIWFEYDRNTSTDWRIVASGTSTRTKETSGTDAGSSTFAVSTNYQWLLMVTNSDWTSVDYFGRANGSTAWTWLGNIADGNIPTSTEITSAACQIVKQGTGTAQRNLSVDSFYVIYDYRR